MFNVEPQEQWTATEIADFEQHVKKQLARTLRAAAWAGAALIVNIVCIIPFLEGHSLHSHWEAMGKYLIITAMPLFLWFVLKVGFVWSSWQSARETRREFDNSQ